MAGNPQNPPTLIGNRALLAEGLRPDTVERSHSGGFLPSWIAPEAFFANTQDSSPRSRIRPGGLSCPVAVWGDFEVGDPEAVLPCCGSLTPTHVPLHSNFHSVVRGRHGRRRGNLKRTVVP